MADLRLLCTMGPDDKCVVHISEPQRRLILGRVESQLLKVLHIDVADDRRERTVVN
jgi:hypothetical protein